MIQNFKTDRNSYSDSVACPVCGTYNNIETKHFGILTYKEIICVKCGSKLAIIEKPKSIFLKLFTAVVVLFIYALFRTIVDKHEWKFFMHALALISGLLVILIIEFKFRQKYIVVPFINKDNLNRIKFINIFFLLSAILFAILIIVFM